MLQGIDLALRCQKRGWWLAILQLCRAPASMPKLHKHVEQKATILVCFRRLKAGPTHVFGWSNIP